MSDQELTTVLWRRRWIVALCIVLGVAAAVAATRLQTELYEATAILQLGPQNPSSFETTPEANQGLATNYATLLTSSGFLERIQGAVLDGRIPAGQLQSQLSAEPIDQTALVQLTARATDPEEAREIVGDVGNAFVASVERDAQRRLERQQREVEERVDGLTEEINRLEASSDSSRAGRIEQLRASRTALIEGNASLVASGVSTGSAASLAAPPSASTVPVRPRPVLNLAAGIVLGGLLGVGLAWLLERFRPSLHSGQEAENALGVPLLASVPLLRRVVPGDARLLDAYELARANIEFQAHDQPVHVLSVIGHTSGLGKTSVIEGLARVALRRGRRTVLVDGDLRAGSLSTRLGYAQRPGLVDVVTGRAQLGDVLVQLGPELWLLPAQAPTDNPPGLLDSQRMRSLLAELADTYDSVLVDAPPIAHLADGLILASMSDGVVLVARTGMSTKEDLASAIAAVDQTRARVLGLIVFEPIPADIGYSAPRSQPRTGLLDETENWDDDDRPATDLELRGAVTSNGHGGQATRARTGNVLSPPLQPQLARVRARLPEGGEWTYEPTWSGTRALAFVDGDHVELQSGELEPLSARFPDLWFPTGRYVLDGEIVFVDSDGLREVGAPRPRVGASDGDTTPMFVASDLLGYEDTSLLDRRFWERRSLLEELLENFAEDMHDVRLVPLVSRIADAEAWLRSAEGVVARDGGASYLPGERTGLVEVRRQRSLRAVVTKWRPGKEDGTIASVTLSVYGDDADLVTVGTVRAIPAGVQRALAARIASLGAGGDPHAGQGNSKPRPISVPPEIVVHVTFKQLAEGRLAPGAKIDEVCEDVDPRSCRVEQLERA